jgi:hypothetical protein
VVVEEFSAGAVSIADAASPSVCAGVLSSIFEMCEDTVPAPFAKKRVLIWTAYAVRLLGSQGLIFEAVSITKSKQGAPNQ